ncbi:E3 SUMO-protein ligase ZBED1-like [Cyprinodon tularosa]|uniref:E3 SUMO-protein ligase ZBED1-like n=1 Tax=Cyprinodon tularosa TaxID=77115 RepID=UPI0018E1E1FD|nr:E3 SUMO-protein ligase ZBED1-like [Cyprinodon tularosa]
MQRRHPENQEPPAPQNVLKQTTFDCKLAPTSTRAKKITESITKFICQDLRPYSVVENRGFKKMISTLEPRYIIPSRKQFTEVLVPRMYDEVKLQVKKSLDSAECVALTCDGWTSRATESYITITSHHINDSWELVSHVLQTRALFESHTGTNIAQVLRAALEEWDLTDKDPAIVTDNASNMNIAAQLANVLRFRCFAHTLNLASQRALKLPAVTRLLVRVRRVTTFFRRSTVAFHVLREKQALLNLPLHKLITDVATRWNSAHDMLERFLEQQPAIHAALLSTEVRKSEKEICTLTDSDITTAEEVVAAMKPMKVATLAVSEEASPTLSIVAPLHAQLIHELQDKPSDSTLTRELKTAMYQDLNKRYLNEKEALYKASALDPRFKALPFLSEDEREDVYNGITAEATRTKWALQQSTSGLQSDSMDVDNGSPNPKQEDMSAASSSKTSKRCSLADLLGQAYGAGAAGPAKKLKTAEDQAKDEMARYKEEASLALSDNPLGWWKEHESQYPFLSRVAKKHLSIPGTSVPSERVFSTAGDIITAKRSVISPEHLDQLLFLNKNIKH